MLNQNIHLILALTFFLSPSSAFARWLTVAESGTVIERLHASYDVKKDGSETEIMDYVVRVQSEDAKASASLFTLDYNAMTDKVEILEAYTLNGKVKVPVEPAAIEDRDKGESKDYDAIKVRSVVFPQVQIGSRLFVRYRAVTARPVVKDRWSDQIPVAPGTPIEDFEVTVKSERPLFWDSQDPRALLTVRQTDKNSLQVKNKKVLPGWVQGEKEPYFHPDGITQVWVSTEREWPIFLQQVNQDFSKVLSAGLPTKLRPWVREAARRKNPEDKILVLMEKMSREFRYFGDWRRHDGGVVPRSLAEIEKSRYGDCKDLSTLLTALLRDAGLNADVALVRRGQNPWGREPDYKLPAVDRFNHAIVRVQMGGRTLWLDPTNPVAALEPYQDIAGRPAWVLEARDGGRFDRLPEASSSRYQTLEDYEYQFLSDGGASVKVRADMKSMAAFSLANEMLMMPRPEVLTIAMDYLSEGHDVKSYRFVREPVSGRVLKDLTMEMNYEAQRVTYNAGEKGAFFVIPDGVLSGPFYETAERESDLKMGDGPALFEGVRRLKNTRLAHEAPKPCRVESEWMDLDRSITMEGSDVVIRQKFNLKRPFIQRSEFRSSSFRRLQDETRQCFYRTGVLIEPAKALSMLDR